MKINTIILIDDNKERKEIFLSELKKKIDYSYTKIEAIFQTLTDLYPEEFTRDKKENYLEFLKKFLDTLQRKNEISVIDIDSLSVKHSDELVYGNHKAVVIYLQKVEEGNHIVIDLKHDGSLTNIVNNIVNGGKNDYK